MIKRDARFEFVASILKTALSHPRLYSHVEIDAWTDEATVTRALSLTEKLVGRDAANGRGRADETIVSAVTKGILAELLVFNLLKQEGLQVGWSVPRHGDTSSFCHDLTLAVNEVTFKIEIKTQHITPEKLFFSYDADATYLVVKNLRENWEHYDVVIAVGVTDDPWKFAPWLVIDHTAFSPDENLFVKRGFGWFLKMDICWSVGKLVYL